jgi:hypothetical protein
MLTSPVHSLLIDIRASWGRASSPTLDVLGASALVLQQRHHRTTKDADVLRTASLEQADEDHLLGLAGPGRPLALRHQIYVEVLGNGVPLLPRDPEWVLLHFEDGRRAPSVRVLSAVDVAVSKLNRFHANDRSDIDHLIQAGLVTHADFVRRFLDAVDVRSFDARADELPAIVRRFHTVERDMFGRPLTAVELPGWV